MKYRAAGFQRNQDILEVIYKRDFKIQDRVEFRLNNPKDKSKLLFYIREKLGLAFSKKEADKIEWW